ncbi:hypothetical protein K505DRAFT_272367 [Melanomma pulvis-pyrius CBS 109.77]|uniref:Zn(2)-C6 fungal-type domain-containing protein n=1 Tax=Melanomma pulvis-pyrius CBS 109.77 TaxID=1314802 RepID=A0A6A6XIE0_9PLEO|nr:hypothetical protein K505DRAFT_272367 [Melanomma pulvis-pyrius CBS 109.77]
MASRELVQQLLPTCQRCRRLRRKCDTQLPDCRLCQKAGAECTFFDHALQQSLPRAYVQSLLTRLEHLKAVRDTLSTSPHSTHQQSSPIASQHQVSPVISTHPQIPQHSHVSPLQPPTSFDKHFPISSQPTRTRFFGASSVFTLSVSVLHHASTKTIISSDYSPPSPPSGATQVEPKQHLSYDSYGQPEAVRSHCKLYFASSNILYGIVDEESCTADMAAYFELRGRRIPASDLHGPDAHAYFRVSMICAIACATLSRHGAERGAESMAYYHDALPCVEEVTSEVGPASLQALLLLTVFCLFYPKLGDIWKVLDYACRLSVELGYHTEAGSDGEGEGGSGDEAERKLRRSTFWGLYAIERITGQLFGRGSDLPESIITTEYPSILTTTSGLDQEALQPISIGHHYRLVYLRSELFKALYLPAIPQSYDWTWYKERCATLRDWKTGLDISEDLAGVATITCDVGYHSTMCFIFQPMMLRALKATEEQSADEGELEISAVPQDNYHSAVALLRTYEKVIRAKESAPLGIYPMTFLSAHYIYLAGLTLMAHALLALDGRLDVVKRMEDLEVDVDGNPEFEKPDWTGVWEASNSCLVLLQWCAERWPGMEGMRDIYLRVAGRVLPEMARKGLL